MNAEQGKENDEWDDNGTDACEDKGGDGVMIPTAEQIQQFHDQGFFVTEPLLGPGELDAMVAACQRALAKTEAELEAQGGHRAITHKGTRYFIAKLHEQSEICRRFVTRGPLVEMATTVLGPEVRLYWNQAVIKPARQGASFAWHQDTGYVPTDPPEYLTY
jgi:hypothetical protein